MASLGVSLALSLGMFLVSERLVFRFLLVARIILILFLFGVFDNDVFIGMALVFPFILEMAAYEDFPANLAVAIAVLIGTFFVKIGTIPKPTEPVAFRNLALYGFGCGLVSFSATLQTRYRQKMIELSREVLRLDRAVVDLSISSEGYLQEAYLTEERSVKGERERITRDLHDGIGYTLTNLSMMLEAARALASEKQKKLREILNNAFGQAQLGLTETRRSLYLLRRQEIRGPVGLMAIDRLIKIFTSATEIHVDVEYGNVPLSCGEDVDEFQYRFVQEGLINAFRHGKASYIKVLFWMDGDMVKVTLRDNGVGSAKIAEGIGLMGMRERLGKLGGTLEISSVVDGFEIKAEIPLVV